MICFSFYRCGFFVPSQLIGDHYQKPLNGHLFKIRGFLNPQLKQHLRKSCLESPAICSGRYLRYAVSENHAVRSYGGEKSTTLLKSREKKV
jgi:hypothetical protein